MLIKKLQGQFEKLNGFYYEFDMHSKPLGEGGMGVVYKGFKIYEMSGARMVVAIKAMFEGLPSEVYERAEREASIRLRNDNLVEMLGFISEVETDPYGGHKIKYYVISEFLNGIVLSDVLKGQLKDKDGIEIPFVKQLYMDYISDREKTSIAIIKNVLAGVMALHDRQFIHRDIDPTNIMVTSDGYIKLIDFGIAKYVGSLGTVDKLRTQAGVFMGKPEYASPELVLGDVDNQGFHTDIYAIGILFYQLIVGELPFSGSIYEVQQMQLNKKVPVKNIKNYLLRGIVKKATEKKKDNRYATSSELRTEIDKIIGLKPNIVKRYWKEGVITLLASVACVSLIYFIPKPDPKPNPDTGPKIVEAETVGNQKDFQPKLTGAFQEALAKLNSNNSQTAKEGLDLMKSLAEDKKDPAAQNELGITYYPYSKGQSSAIMQRRRILGLNDKTSEALSIQYLESVNSKDALSVHALYILGYNYWRNRQWDKGIDVLSKALEKINHSSEVSFNGLPKDSLKKEIEKYLSLCQKRGN